MDRHNWEADNFCRACVQELNTIKTGEATGCVNILETRDLLNKLSSCISKEFAASNKCSKYLCMSCYQKIAEFYEFREICTASMRCFEGLPQHKEGLPYEEKALLLSGDVFVKTEYELNDQVMTSHVMNASVVLPDNANVFKQAYEDANKNSEPIMNSVGHLSEAVEGSLIDAVHLEPAVNTQEEPVFDEDDMDFFVIKNSAINSSLNESNDHQRSEYESRTRSKVNSATSTISNDIKYKRTYKYCQICPARFFSEHHLIGHERKHKGIVPYLCTRENCEKSFQRFGELSRHLLEQHDNPSEYVCDQVGCGRVYRHKNTLTAHQRSHHKLDGPKSHKCELCSKTFTTAADLKKHGYTHLEPHKRRKFYN